MKKNKEKIDSENPGANNSAVENCTGKEWAVEKFYRRIREEGEHWRLDNARTHLPQTHSHPISLSNLNLVALSQLCVYVLVALSMCSYVIMDMFG